MRYFFIFLLIVPLTVLSQEQNNFSSEEVNVTPLIDGTLLLPDSTSSKFPLAIIIGGSGPTDRDGNQPMMNNNSLKLLAQGLAKNGIASFRYDKRIVKQIRRGKVEEQNIRFQDFIDDAEAVLNKFKEDDRFSKIYIIGHSQGSLIGMVAAQKGADGFISIAGAGQEIDDVIVDQLSQQAPGLVENARQSFDDIRATGFAHNYDPNLASIFRKEIQPFIYSWMLYNPKEEIAKLNIPILIINGTKDIQVQVSEAELLKEAAPKATYEIIPNMNHIFREVEGNSLENSKTYNQPNLPIVPQLVTSISEFIQKSK